jgi:hypothetical protein
MSQYLQTDEQHDVLVSLREVRNQILRTDQDINFWKWALIALASAVNGALTCNLSGTMQVGALCKRNAKRTIAALQIDSSEKLPEPRLANPHELLRRAKGHGRIERAGPLIYVTASQEKSFLRLFEFRNQFIHFHPTSWSIEMTGMPSTFLDVMQIIEGAIDDGWSFRHLDETLGEELRTLFAEIVKELKQRT